MTKLKIKNRYGVTPNEVLNNKELSFKAKGLYGYIQSKPEDWDFSSDRIKHDTRESRDAIRSGLKELEEVGYLIREKKKDSKGKFYMEYVLLDKPKLKKRTTENTAPGVPAINKERIIKKETKRKKHNNNTNRVITDESVKSDLVVINKDTDNTPTKKEYGDKNINAIIETVKMANSGIIDGTIKEQRQYGKLLYDKLMKIDIINEGKIEPMNYLFALIGIIHKHDNYFTHKLNSTKSIYYNLATLIQRARAIKKEQEENSSFCLEV